MLELLNDEAKKEAEKKDDKDLRSQLQQTHACDAFQIANCGPRPK